MIVLRFAMRLLSFTFFLVNVAIAGCTNGGDSSPKMCMRPEGSYRLMYTEDSGDCGDQNSIVYFSADDGDSGTKCEASEMRSADGCRVDREETCELKDRHGNSIGTISRTGTLEILDKAASHLVWTLEITADADDGSGCHSVGTATIDKI
jgi:hypothetical protein